MHQLIEFIKADEHLQDVRQIAYVLATVHHETAGTFEPIVERGSRDYFKQYDVGTKKAMRLGNDVVGDGYLYRGRGYVQITGKINYRHLGAVIGQPLLTNPELALNPDVAYKILSVGMRKGLFTGRGLDHYFNADDCDWVNARRIINGTDCAQKIAAQAERYFDKLFDGGFDAL